MERKGKEKGKKRRKNKKRGNKLFYVKQLGNRQTLIAKIYKIGKVGKSIKKVKISKKMAPKVKNVIKHTYIVDIKLNQCSNFCNFFFSRHFM